LFSLKPKEMMPGKNNEIKTLTERNDVLENYFKNTIIPQLYIDGDQILRKFTPPAMKQFSLSPDDLGKHIEELKDNIRFPTFIENIQDVLETNEILEKEIQTTDLKWYQMNILPYIEGETGKINGVIITFVDITARIRELNTLEKLISDHETLLDTISHDVKTPLTTLVLTIELFKNVSLEDQKEFQKLLQMLDTAIKKMHDIINELTDARKQQYKYKSEEELVNFGHILEDVRLTLSHNIKESGAIIKSELNVQEITFSRRKLRSIIYNLVNNAIKFKSKDHPPEIFVKTEREEDFIVISIKDNGIGIDSPNKEAIFSKYFRLQNNVEGSGIGLYLVKEIVTNAGGKILLESQPGKGSEFKVYLKSS
jgi:two-component system phosphate regulon sensor histidine kinase PhoR